ncbi:RNA recognition motif domain-containing protein [Stenomitos frigidus]|uniref:RNA-binding protein n=1 Tax=Stenomitos frigidus ULC18 TaxID=2107698 RepID=A0A2T1E341_9CYAN|nr:RNA-binding protein [Stenomitos frigidus]PSB27158.1 RNA-binding protein [Stenomitos frigidus ULC18]
MSIRLYVGNLPEDLSRQELEAIFTDEGDSISIKIITDRKTNKCRGFGFVTVKSEEQADEIIEKFNGYQLKENALKVERAQPRAKDKADEDSPTTSAPVPAGSTSGGARRKGASNNSGGNNKSRRTGGTQTDSDSVQPDPRWAQELEKLKQLLAAQTTNT